MVGKLIVFSLVSFLHDFFTVVWMGGLIVTAFVFLPSVKEVLGATPQTKKVIATFQKKQSVWVYVSMVGLIVTGLLMVNRSPEYIHLFSFANPYSVALSIKHLLVLVMIGLSLYRSLVLGGQKGPMTPEKERLSARLLLTNAILAIVMLLNSGIVAALARPH
jgi:uncharacterized membrane protein